MIIDKTIKFGYGDICVGSDTLRSTLYFYGIKPPLNVGERITDEVEVVSEKIEFHINYDEYMYISHNLSCVKNGTIRTFYFRDYIFDFTNYNPKSVEVVERHAFQTLLLYRLALAA